MTLPSTKDKGALMKLMDNDSVFKDKMDFATALAGKIGPEAVMEIYAAQLSLQQLSDGGYPSEMESVIRDKAKATFRRYAKFLGAVSSLGEPRLSRSYGPGESPAHTLPSESLSLIFNWAAETQSSIGPKGWTPRLLRLICRHWKKVAEETPSLWRNIDFSGSMEWTHRSIQWSKSVPLDVSLVGYGLPTATFVERAQVALVELSRIRTLSVANPKEENIALLVNLFASRPAPWLIELGFTAGNMYTAGTGGMDVFHSGTFAGEVPTRLRKLVMSYAKINPSFPAFSAPLVTLDLQFCNVWQTVDQLLHSLNSLPNLEHLILRTNSEVPRMHASKVHDFKPKGVKLRNLKTLCLRNELAVILAIFPHLDIPNASTVSIAIDCEGATSIMHPNALSEMSTVFGSYLNNVFGDNTVLPGGFTTLAITPLLGWDGGYDAVFTEPAECRDGLTEFSLGFTHAEFVEISHEALFMRTLAWAPLNNRITRLVATEDVYFLNNDAIWAQIIGCLPSLAEVHVRESAPELIRSLSTCDPEEARSLRKLVFETTAFADPLIDALGAFILCRREKGHPSMNLSFITCKISDAALDKLKETMGVGEVYVFTGDMSALVDDSDNSDDE
ncbi:unnamed protein product [Peniophora sp. CBMAI 1063]|nr:unnamed protein product [Peniophora sp. CBMAI 1063]